MITASAGPVRTCIGCRTRAAAAELLRVVAVPDATAAGEHPVTVVPDPRRRLPGRGAWLHPRPRCADLASRRRAFGRALRLRGEIDPGPVCEYVAQAEHDQSVTMSTTPTGGTPQEMTSNGHSMKRQQ